MCLAPTSAFAWPRPIPTVEKVIKPGQSQKFGWFLSVDPTCRPIGPWTVNLIEPSGKGQVIVEQGPGYPSFPPMNPRSACNKHTISATRLIYSAPPGPADDDQFVIEIVDPLGNAKQVRYHVGLH
ncbi:hypothetical protein FF100_27190 [Methylobacterium terricola]|uniref:Uncharacterized protein n=1 Tax=Methylobacterium terricola TaxID=2583531 RepID=A0A5C4LAK2_9HYPH|nr:hypothetical protein [Methylobacterium terricola]TNC09251.1 hypothetical protein FF100_27190 [Methylobacterium terricola]